MSACSEGSRREEVRALEQAEVGQLDEMLSSLSNMSWAIPPVETQCLYDTNPRAFIGAFSTQGMLISRYLQSILFSKNLY